MESAVLEGTIVKGLGEGAFFMSIEHYKQEIKSKLGFEAYPGTLNVKIPADQTGKIEVALKTRIEGFQDKDKRYGGVNCYKARIQNINGAIIIPDLTKHNKEIIEFISKDHVKSTLNVADGQKIIIELK